MIPETTREALLDAMHRFDSELRNTTEWSNWEQKANYRYAINHEGRRYPVKQIIAMATGLPVNRFSGGSGYVAKRGFPVVSLYSGNAAEPIDIDFIQGSLESVLKRYASTRAGEPFGKEHPLWSLFDGLQRALASSDPVRKRPTIKVTWSAGRGKWANLPWIAFTDTREPDAPQGGVYSVFLFRQDLSGIYLALMQGTAEPKKKFGSRKSLKLLRSRTETLRKQCGNLNQHGFALDNQIDLHAESGLGADYEAATIAYKFYKAGEVPDDTEILQDVDALLQAYEDYLAYKSGKRSPITKESEPARELASATLLSTHEAASAMAALVKTITGRGFVFEPWQIAAYVAALRTKPFVILSGVSGTGKSKLPALVAAATGGESYLLPVRPDWTDSSDILGYLDLQGHFRPGPLLELARVAAELPEKHFVCIVDEMNLARVEHYFAEVLSRIEDRRPSPRSGFESGPLLVHKLREADALWAAQGLPPNLAIVGTVNMDESAHGFSRKVLDRAFTLELSDLDLTIWESGTLSEIPTALWPATAWYPRAIQLSSLGTLRDEERESVCQSIETLNEVNKFLAQAQLQVGYRTRDEVALFVLHAREFASSFVTRAGEIVDPLDLALQMKLLPRLVGGSNSIRRTVLQLLGWAYSKKPFQTEQEADPILDAWKSDGCRGALTSAQYPRTAARLSLMWDRLQNEGFTSFWL